MNIYAQVTNEGTAMSETALCGDCWAAPSIRAKYACMMDAEYNEPLTDASWHDCTGNDYLQARGCNECGSVCGGDE